MHLITGPRNSLGAHYFHLLAQDREGRLAQEPLLRGLVSSGPEPAYNWIEVMAISPSLIFNPQDPSSFRLVSPPVLRRLLAQLIPPRGHFMVEYDSLLWRTTRLAMSAGVPAVLTLLGSLLFDAGCGVPIRDWYLAEGGREGPRKLWGFKALNEELARSQAKEMARELSEYLALPPRPG